MLLLCLNFTYHSARIITAFYACVLDTRRTVVQRGHGVSEKGRRRNCTAAIHYILLFKVQPTFKFAHCPDSMIANNTGVLHTSHIRKLPSLSPGQAVCAALAGDRSISSAIGCMHAGTRAKTTHLFQTRQASDSRLIQITKSSTFQPIDKFQILIYSAMIIPTYGNRSL